LAELITKDISKFADLTPLTDWAIAFGSIAMMFSSALQIWIGIAGIHRRCTSTKERLQGISAIE
jgi:hypothetical protein